jgi:hypothetical protein
MSDQSRGLTPQQHDSLIAFMHAACQIVPARYPPNACIACARITQMTLTRHRLQVRPCSVEAVVLNPALAARQDRTGRTPRHETELDQWYREDGSCFVHLGTGAPQADCWAGHLVALVERTILIDLSLPQINSPEHDIHLMPVLCSVPRGFAEGRTVHRFAMAGCRVEYRCRPDKIGYQTAVDWCDIGRHQRAVAEIEALMQPELAGCPA